jgi:hypothetical protein
VLGSCRFWFQLLGCIPGLDKLLIFKVLRCPDLGVPQDLILRRFVGALDGDIRAHVRGVVAVAIPGVQFAH